MIRYRSTKKLSNNPSTIRRNYLKFQREKLAYLRNKTTNRQNIQPHISIPVSFNNQNSDSNIQSQFVSDAIEATNDVDVSDAQICTEFCNDRTSQWFEESDTDDFEEFANIEELSDDDTNDTNNSENTESHKSYDLVDFKNELARVFVNTNITHAQGDQILSVLRSHPCFNVTLPRSMKTLLKTPRKPLQTIKMGSGEYYHVGLAAEILQKIKNFEDLTVDHLIIDIHTDGMSAHHSTNTQIWPIQFRIINISDEKPAIIGVYVGSKKPSDAMEYFKYLIEEFRSINALGGIQYKGKLIRIILRGLIADAPARALILNHRGHNATNPCSKCKISGQSFQRTMCFLSISDEPRTYEEYYNATDKNHHFPTGNSPLKYLGIDMIKFVPFEYMHLICLGVMKKFLTAIVEKKYTMPNLSATNIKYVSDRLSMIEACCPYEFSRHPRPLEDYQQYKATDFRQILLYTGPVIFHGMIEDTAYTHFLLLHTACRVLSVTNPNEISLEYAEIALRVYVECCNNIYGSTFLTYNIHGLLHVIDDVKTFGNLNTYSAFPYEDNMTFFRKFLRKPGKLLQQLHNRISEGRNFCNTKQKTSIIKPLHKHLNGPVISVNPNLSYQQFKGLQFEYFKLMAKNNRDDCVILKSGIICRVLNIIKIHSSNEYKLIIQKYNSVKNFYNIPYGPESYFFGTYICSNLSNEMEEISLHDLYAKCFKMPYWNNGTIQTGTYVVITLLSNH